MQGHELRAIRKSLGMTQGQLATELGFSVGFVGEMERGEKGIETRTQLAVRALLGDRQPGDDKMSAATAAAARDRLIAALAAGGPIVTLTRADAETIAALLDAIA